MKNYITAFVCVIVLLFFAGCFEKGADGKAGSDEIARYLNYVPSSILPDQSIDLEFIAPVPGAGNPGTEISKDLMDFDPDIEGVLVWKNERTISYIPDDDLNQGQTYKAKLMIRTLSENYKDVPDYEFDFYVVKRDVKLFTGDIQDAKGSKAFYEAKIFFNLKTDLKKLKNAIDFTMNGNDFPFELSYGQDSATIVFRTSEFDQSDEKKLFNFKISKNKIEIASDYFLEFSFTKKEEMEIVQISRRTDDENPSVEIKFASELSPDQDVTGLISVSPQIQFELKKTGKSIIVSGSFEYGKEYEIRTSGKLMNKYGFSLNKDHTAKVEFMDKAPKLDFLDKGCFLSAGNNKRSDSTRRILREYS